MNYKMKINYSNFIDVDVGEWNGEKCLIIPMKKNNIYARNRTISQNFNIVEKISYIYKSSHYVRQYWSKRQMEKMNTLGFKYSPIVGNLSVDIPKFKFDKYKLLNSQQGVKEINKNIDEVLNR